MTEATPNPSRFLFVNNLPVLHKLSPKDKTELIHHFGLRGGTLVAHYIDAMGVHQKVERCRRIDIPDRFRELAPAPFDPKANTLNRTPSPEPFLPVDLNDADVPESKREPILPTDEPIVTLRSGEPVTTSLAVAQGTDNQHKNVMALLRTYVMDLREFGEVAFETRPNQQGSVTEYALLNEQQATLLITYMKNTEIVRKFKMRLVKAFYALRLGQEHPPAVSRPLSPSEMFLAQAQLNVDYERQLQALGAQNRTLALQQSRTSMRLDHLSATVTQPMIDVYGGLVLAGDDVSMMWVCKRLGVKRNELFQHLRERRVLMTGGSKHNYPYATFERCFAPKTIPVNAGERMAKALKVTPEGIKWLCRCYHRGEFDAFLTRPRQAQVNLTRQPGDDDVDTVDL